MSLRARLTAVLVVLFLVAGGGLLLGLDRGARLYFEEVHYKLNHEVAQHLASSRHPFLTRTDDVADLDQDVLKMIFMDVMKTNPSLEVYLLDAEGRILAHDLPEGSVVRERVALEPIQAAVRFAGDPGAAQEIPRGDDPRDRGRSKPVSVVEFRGEAGELEGYLYVILGGEAHREVAASLESSALLRGSALLVAGSVTLAVVVGAVSIAFLVRPLRRLRDAMITFEEGERPVGLAGPGRDEVSDLAATFETMAGRIANQLEELERKDRRRREFVADVSHDLRTPTGVIQGYLETLTLRWKRLEDAEREQFLRTALHQAERLGRLVDRLFELARLEAEEFQPDMEPFPVDELVADVVAEFQPRAEKAGVQLHGSIAYDLPPIVGDIGLIERLLDNLVDNALRVTLPGGSVRVGLARGSAGLELSVRDTGPGIPQDDLLRIFDRYYRVGTDEAVVAEAVEGEDAPGSDSNGTRRASRGTGLGLAIARRIAQIHGGTIEVASRPGEGSVFTVVLPVQGRRAPRARSARREPRSDGVVISP